MTAREDLAFEAAWAHHEAADHGVVRCGGTWECLDCDAGSRRAPACESGWTGDRCTYPLHHDGPHSNP